MIRVGQTRNLLRAPSSLLEMWPRSAHHHPGQRRQSAARTGLTKDRTRSYVPTIGNSLQTERHPQKKVRRQARPLRHSPQICEFSGKSGSYVVIGSRSTHKNAYRAHVSGKTITGAAEVVAGEGTDFYRDAGRGGRRAHSPSAGAAGRWLHREPASTAASPGRRPPPRRRFRARRGQNQTRSTGHILP